jgi:DNA gyrase subunit B
VSGLLDKIREKKKKAKAVRAGYDEDSCKVHLLDVDKVRARPVMYLGNEPIFQMLKEGVDNAIDEFSECEQDGRRWNVYVKHEYIKLKSPKSSKGKESDASIFKHTFTVADRGRGIPVGIHKVAKIPTVTAMLTMLQAGGKFDNKSYAAGKGTHGVGIAATNAASEQFEVWTYRENKWHYQCFKQGKPLSTKLQFKDPAKEFAKNKRGTVIKFTVDTSIEQIAVDQFDLGKVKSWLNITSMVDSPIKIQFEYQQKSGMKSVEYYQPDGALKYLEMKIADNKLETLGKKPFSFTSKMGTVVCQWASTEEALFDGYTNGIFNMDGGTHIDGFYRAITKAYNSVAKNKKKELTTGDLRAGLVGIINVRLPEAQYGDQTKNKLKSPIAKDVEDSLLKPLTEWFTKNKAMVKLIFDRAAALRNAREQSKKIMKAASAIKDNRKGAVLPGILTACDPKCAAADREIFFVEGDSAAGTAKSARDKFSQQIFKMKGKAIPNIAKKDRATALSSPVIQTMLAGIGVDSKSLKGNTVPTFNVGRMLALVDPDPDGFHILNLWLTAIYVLVPQAYELGLVYIVDSPLFVASAKNKKVFGYTLKEIKKNAPKGAVITRLKGWAEAEIAELEEIAFNPATRKLLKVLPVPNKDGVQFMAIVGKDVTERKRILGVSEDI